MLESCCIVLLFYQKWLSREITLFVLNYSNNKGMWNKMSPSVFSEETTLDKITKHEELPLINSMIFVLSRERRQGKSQKRAHYDHIQLWGPQCTDYWGRGSCHPYRSRGEAALLCRSRVQMLLGPELCWNAYWKHLYLSTSSIYA